MTAAEIQAAGIYVVIPMCIMIVAVNLMQVFIELKKKARA